MKQFKTLIFISLVALLVSSPLFASGVVEKGKDFSSIDLATATGSEMEAAWSRSLESYNTQRSTLRSAMDEAIRNNDVSDYLELRGVYGSLKVPEITEEENDIILERILNSQDEDEKAALSSFLYASSRYYHPVLTFQYEVKGERMTRTYRKTVSVAPGSEVEVPSLEGEGLFQGWSLDGTTVSYKSGEKMSMPYTDTILYPIFTSGISFSDPVTGLASYTEGNVATLPENEAGEGLVFLGWYDEYGRKAEGDSVTVENGKSAKYTAYWKGLEIGDGSIRYYEEGKIPSGTQVLLSFPLVNIGNVPLNSISVKIEGEGVTVLSSSSLKVTLVGSSSTISPTFLIYVDGEKGEEKVITVTATDKDGNLWQKDLKFILQ